MSSEVGCVVVGQGQVGQYRVRDLRRCEQEEQFKGTDMGRLRLKGVVCRRNIDLEGVPKLTLEEALKRDDVQVVIVTTENNTHYDCAKKVLQAKKNVIVEYPLALSSAQAKELYQIAKENGVLCHEEGVSMVIHSYGRIQDHVKKSPPTKECTYELVSKLQEDWKGTGDAGSPFFSQMSLLHNHVDHYGDMEAVSAWVDLADRKVCAKGVLKAKDSDRIHHVVVDRSGDKPRRRIFFHATFEDGTKYDDELNGMPNERNELFMRDLALFMEEYTGQKQVKEWLVVRCIELAEQLTKLAKDNPDSINAN